MAAHGNYAIRELPSIASSAGPARPWSAAKPAAGVDSDAPLDRRQLINRCLGRIELAERLIASFQTRFPEEVGQIERSLADGDDVNLVRQLHQLKGAAANVSAPALHVLLSSMEQSARGGDRQAVVARLDELYAAWDRLKHFLETGASAASAPVSEV